jgi:hypothetical protein
MNVVWRSVKRNPIINVAVLAIIAQAIVEAMEDGHYDLKTIATYALQLSLAYVAREFTVPAKEHEAEMQELTRQANQEIANTYNQAARDIKGI